jgi:hypothetical protein
VVGWGQLELQATLQIEAGWPDEKLLVEAFELNETLSLALQSYLSLTTATAAADAAAPIGQMQLGVPADGTAAATQESEEEMIARAIQASLQVWRTQLKPWTYHCGQGEGEWCISGLAYFECGQPHACTVGRSARRSHAHIVMSWLRPSFFHEWRERRRAPRAQSEEERKAKEEAELQQQLPQHAAGVSSSSSSTPAPATTADPLMDLLEMPMPPPTSAAASAASTSASAALPISSPAISLSTQPTPADVADPFASGNVLEGLTLEDPVAPAAAASTPPTSGSTSLLDL